MPHPTICFVASSHIESSPGGDTVQWRMYDRAAREAGLKTRTWFDNSPVPQADVVHAFNVDRPLGIYPKLVQAKRLGIPVILSTIHHPHEWLARARRFEPPAGVLGRLLCRSPVGRSVPFTEAARELAMLVRGRRLPKGFRVCGPPRTVPGSSQLGGRGRRGLDREPQTVRRASRAPRDRRRSHRAQEEQLARLPAGRDRTAPCGVCRRAALG